MAKATYNPPIPVAPIPGTITLELSLEEAQVTFDIMGTVTGNDEKSRRGLTSNIWNALRETHAGLLMRSRVQVKDWVMEGIHFNPKEK